MRINFKKIFAVVAILGIGVATFTPLTTYAVSGTDAQISGGGGGASKIDSAINQRDQDEADKMLNEDPDQVASILTTVLQNASCFRIRAISSCGECIQERPSKCCSSS